MNSYKLYCISSLLKIIHKGVLVLIFTLFVIGCNTAHPAETEVKTNNALPAERTIEVYDFEQIEPLLYTEKQNLEIVNFWAMWCVPCVKELPYLQAYADAHPEATLTLVSLDFEEDIETKLKPFLKQKDITAKVILLNDPDANTWIDKIDPNWSGAIPFTIIFNKDKRSYYERNFETLEDLETEINQFLNTQK